MGGAGGGSAAEQHMPIEEMELFRRYVLVADWAWDAVAGWPPFARDTVGKQLVRALDSIAAYLVEGDGRYTDRDALHFFVMARGSAREARYWLQRAMARRLLDGNVGQQQIGVVTSATQLLNKAIAYRRRRATVGQVSEEHATYGGGYDPSDAG